MNIPAPQLTQFATAVLAACGMPVADAAITAACIVEGDLTGADAHGVFRLPQYVDAFDKKHINPRADVKTVEHGAATALIDGDNGMGHLAVEHATRLAIRLAGNAGLAWVGVRNSNHAGAGGVYAAIAAERGMIGIYGAGSGFNQMAPWGGAEPLLGTNPLAIGIPAGKQAPVIIDFATSIASAGMIKAAALRGETIPAGWMVDPGTGDAVTDPAKMMQSLLAPIGEHKGSGLALAIGLLAGVLNGASFGRDIPRTGSGFGVNSGQFIIVLDAARFAPNHNFGDEIDRHIGDFALSRALPGVERVRVPGQARAERKRERLANGVAISAPLKQQLDALATRFGIAPLSP
jgi:LDH2 family malate/lactate/ureidoglycolate dehydrogenase